jgi:hypothetical protein
MCVWTTRAVAQIGTGITPPSVNRSQNMRWRESADASLAVGSPFSA